MYEPLCAGVNVYQTVAAGDPQDADGSDGCLPAAVASNESEKGTELTLVTLAKSSFAGGGTDSSRTVIEPDRK